MPSTTTRINISLSEDLLTMLRNYVPVRGLSRFLSDAAKEKMDRIKRDKALKNLLAAPPTFTNIGNASAYVRAIRKESEKRARRLGI